MNKIQKIEEILATAPTGDVELTPKQATEWLPFSVRTIKAMVLAGKLGWVDNDMGRNKYWIPLSDIRDYLTRNKQPDETRD